MIISLTGFMGCGKSTYGRQAATRLGVPFIDLDDYIESHSGRKISEIFASDGEKSFREMEAAALKEILAEYGKDNSQKPTLILSLGGGTLTTPECASLLQGKTFCIYLRATIDTLIENLKTTGWENRPMLGKAIPASPAPDSSPETALRHRIETLMSQREDTYTKTSRLVIDTDGKTGEDIAREIVIPFAN